MLYIPSPFSPTFFISMCVDMPCKSHPYVRISPDITHIARYYWCISRPSISSYIGTYLCISAVVSIDIYVAPYCPCSESCAKKNKKNNIYRYMHNMSRKKWGKSSTKIGGKQGFSPSPPCPYVASRSEKESRNAWGRVPVVRFAEDRARSSMDRWRSRDIAVGSHGDRARSRKRSMKRSREDRMDIA